MQTESVSHRGRRIERYGRRQRAAHWLIAVSFILAGISGLALFHPSLFWLSALLGGGAWARILHPFIGVILCVVFFPFAVNLARYNIMHAHDWDWLARAREVMLNREDSLPPVDRYNAGQKLLFWTMVAAIALLLITGFVLWRPYFAPNFSLTQIRIAAVIHSASALVIILGIIVHIYAAIWIRGSVRAMTQGWVSAAWAKRHHRLWYDKLRTIRNP